MRHNACQEALAPQRHLAGRPLPRVGLGCARIGSFNNPASLRKSQELLAAALAAGVALFDTADIYGQGDSERVIGRLARRSPLAPVVVTKAGYKFSWKMRLVRPLKPLLRPTLRRFTNAGKAVTARRAEAIAQDFSPAHLINACTAARRRLGVPRLDAFLLHDPSAEVLGEGSAIATLRSLLKANVVSAFGVSLDDEAALAAALDVDDLGVLEIPMTLFSKLGAVERAALARRGVVVLLRGVLSAAAGRPVAAALREALRDPLVASIIVGTTDRRHLDEIASVAESLIDESDSRV